MALVSGGFGIAVVLVAGGARAAVAGGARAAPAARPVPATCEKISVILKAAKRPTSERFLGPASVGDLIKVAGFWLPVERSGPLEFLACEKGRLLYRWQQGRRGALIAIRVGRQGNVDASGRKDWLSPLSSADLQALRSVALDRWDSAIARAIRGVPWQKACIELPEELADENAPLIPLPPASCLIAPGRAAQYRGLSRWLHGFTGLRRFHIDDESGSGGVTIDLRALARHRHIEHLDLPQVILRNAAELGRLRSLNTLRLDGTELKGAVSSLALLSHLRALSVSNASLRQLPPLSRLTRLRALDVSGNELKVDTFMQGLSALERLDLSGNQIKTLTAVERFAALVRLDVHGNRLETLPSLSALRRLEWMDVSYNDLASLEPLAEAPALRVVYAKEIAASRLPTRRLPLLRRLSLLGTRIVAAEVSRFRVAHPAAQVIATWQDLLRSRFGLADRLVVRTVLARRTLRSHWSIVREIRGRSAVWSVLNRVDGRINLLFSCGCLGQSELILYAAARRLGHISIHHGDMVRFASVSMWLTAPSRTWLAKFTKGLPVGAARPPAASGPRNPPSHRSSGSGGI